MYLNEFLKSRIVSGMRTTGPLHIGHYQGVLKNWLVLQKKHECFFFAADLHAITTQYKNTYHIKERTINMILEWLSVGINPERSNIFVQSLLPEHSELHLLLSMITPMNWLNRVPSYKDQKNDKSTYGFLGYPVLQSSDILLYQPNYVPIGEDQISHIEITRKIARKFNFMYGKKINIIDDIENIFKILGKKERKSFLYYMKMYKKNNTVVFLRKANEIIIKLLKNYRKKKLSKFISNKNSFKEPQFLLGKYSKLLGYDGKKMSKSYNNTIGLLESPENIKMKIKKMVTDPKRTKIMYPGVPENCSVWEYHKSYSNSEEQTFIYQSCTSAKIGCFDCKNILSDRINSNHYPIRKKYNLLKKNKGYVLEIVKKGTFNAKKVASKTLLDVKEAIGLLI